MNGSVASGGVVVAVDRQGLTVRVREERVDLTGGQLRIAKDGERRQALDLFERAQTGEGGVVVELERRDVGSTRRESHWTRS